MILDARVDRDLATLADFIELYCTRKHATADKTPVSLKTHNIVAITGTQPELCESCTRLLTHAFVKRTHCPLVPKPSCKKCPVHCYAPAYREQIREVMAYAGPRMVLSGRLDYLVHLLF